MPLLWQTLRGVLQLRWKYQRFTSRVAIAIMECLHTRQSMKDIAKQTGTSVSGVARCLGLQPQTPPRLLPEVLSIDKLKGDVDGEKFQCILTAPLQHKVFDILPNRLTSTVQAYLKGFPNQSDVKVVVMDMNKGFRDVMRAFLPDTKIVIDRFHVVRYCNWAMEDVRRKLQKSLKPENTSNAPENCFWLIATGSARRSVRLFRLC